MSTQVDYSDAIPAWSLGDRLRKAREHAGLEQAEMARELGTSRTTVGNAERGDRTPRRSLVMAWSLRTGVPLVWLETGEAPAPDGDDGERGRPRGTRTHNPRINRLPQVVALRAVAA